MTITQNDSQPEDDGLVEEADALSLTIDEAKLAEYIEHRKKQSENWYKTERHLYERRKKNEEYYLGKQLNEDKFKDWQARFVDNVVYEAEATIKPIALSRLPDLLVQPGNESIEAKDLADKITDVINNDIRRREHRRVLAMAHKHIPLYFIAAIKCIWNPQKGKHGDYEFYVVHPDNLTLDHNASGTDILKQDFVIEKVRLSAKEVVIRFPEKEEAFMKELGYDANDRLNEGKMATKIDIYETWFKWYDKRRDGTYETISAVAWKYKKIILKKMKNPYWDWEGDPITFKYDQEKNERQEVNVDEMKNAAMFGVSIPGLQKETIYNNYFENPKFPYILLGYDQLGKMPLDETSRIEQVLYLQDNVNIRGRQITDMANRSKGKNIYSNSSGLDTADLEKIDSDDPNVDILVKGKVNDVHSFIPGEQPSSALFQDQDINRNRIFQKMGTNSTTRGEVETDTATTAQIAREADYGRIDDLVEDTINYAAEEMAGWVMQMIKLFYTRDHMVRIMGKDGNLIFENINQDMIEDGMQVIVHASGVDKILRKKEAYELAKLGPGYTDPLAFFKDVGASNPKERAKSAYLYANSPNEWFTQYILELDSPAAMGAALNGTPPEAPLPGASPGLPPAGMSPPEMAQAPAEMTLAPQIDPQAAADIQQLQQGVVPPDPQQITSAYLDQLTAFSQSPEFANLTPEAQAFVIKFIPQPQNDLV